MLYISPVLMSYHIRQFNYINNENGHCSELLQYVSFIKNKQNKNIQIEKKSLEHKRLLSLYLVRYKLVYKSIKGNVCVKFDCNIMHFIRV